MLKLINIAIIFSMLTILMGFTQPEDSSPGKFGETE